MAKDKRNFLEMGYNIPLFLGPVHEVSGHEENRLCSVCGVEGPGCRREGQFACYKCIESGKAPASMDTAIGFLDVDRTFHPNEGNEVTIAAEDIDRLLKTPEFETWQGCIWLFCCDRAAKYLGVYQIDDWNTVATETQKSVVEVLKDACSISSDQADDLLYDLKDGQHSSTYAFRCAKCDKLLASFDAD